jgi:hypothetical protein
MLGPLARAQEVDMTIKGGNAKTIQVDRVVVVKEDRIVVSSFPFSVHAPPGGALYFWTVPPTVSGLDRGEKYDVASAPKGDLTIGVKIITVDFDKKTFVTTFGQITFSVGEPGPGPKPPDPVPPDPVEPTDPLFAPLKAAWLSEPASTRVADRDAYAAIFREAAGWIDAMKYSLVIDYNREMTKKRDAAIDGRLALVRKVVNDELGVRLPKAADAKVSADVGRTMKAEFLRVEALLKALK